jgi:hypothetical protein
MVLPLEIQRDKELIRDSKLDNVVLTKGRNITNRYKINMEVHPGRNSNPSSTKLRIPECRFRADNQEMSFRVVEHITR